jgi:hypothetical protein
MLRSFGPPWRHPLGGHVYQFFVLAHLVFLDAALARWRSMFRPTARARSGERPEQETVRRFERHPETSPDRQSPDPRIHDARRPLPPDSSIEVQSVQGVQGVQRGSPSRGFEPHDPFELREPFEPHEPFEPFEPH